MLIKILAVVAVIIVILAVIVALQPASFRIARSANISAPPQAVFAQVNDFHKWEAWNPWGKIDPSMKQTYEGAPAGPGAVYSWVGNKEVGEGRMTITESRPSDFIRVKLEFFKPFAATHTAEFTFKPEGNGTLVTWSMFGENNFMAKAIHLFMNMDKMIGGQFDQGLASMKAAVEGGQRDNADGPVLQIPPNRNSKEDVQDRIDQEEASLKNSSADERHPWRMPLMNIALWIVQVLLAALFLFAGGFKLVTPMEEMMKQMPVALPGWFVIFTAIVEVLGGLGVILPWLTGIRPSLTPLAAAGLVIVMIGATAYTLIAGDIASALMPAVVGLLAAFVAYGRWRSSPPRK